MKNSSKIFFLMVFIIWILNVVITGVVLPVTEWVPSDCPGESGLQDYECLHGNPPKIAFYNIWRSHYPACYESAITGYNPCWYTDDDWPLQIEILIILVILTLIGLFCSEEILWLLFGLDID